MYHIKSQSLREELRLKGKTISKEQASRVYSLTFKETADVPVDEFKLFPALYRLSIMYCGLEDIGFLRGLKNISTINFQYNNITDLTPALELPKMSHLHVGANPIRSADGVEELVNVKDVLLYDCGLKEFPAFREGCKLEMLNIDNNRICGLQFLKQAKELKQLQFNNNYIEDLSPLYGMDELVYIHAKDNQIKSLEPLFTLPRLRGIFIDGNPVSRKEVAMLEVNMVLNEHELSVLKESAYQRERAWFWERHHKSLPAGLLDILTDLVYICRKDEVLKESKTEYKAKCSYPMTENKRAMKKIQSMQDGWMKTRMLGWMAKQKPVQAPVLLDEEYKMTPGRPGSMVFYNTGSGIFGGGEPYTVDKSEYIELMPYG